MKKSTFYVGKMDCPAEEQLIRLKLLENNDALKIEASIPERKVIVLHHGSEQNILHALEKLHLSSSLVESIDVQDDQAGLANSSNEESLLWKVLLINLSFFIIEFSTGVLFNSMGLIGDGLDMLADSFVYGLAIWAVGASAGKKKRVAGIAGVIQFSLALFGMVEVIRRFYGFEGHPDYQVMAVVSALALIGNAACLYLLQKTKSAEPHIQASKIFTSGDVVVNLGVMAAGALVFLTESKIPDLLIGSIIFLFVGWGAFRIMRLSR